MIRPALRLAALLAVLAAGVVSSSALAAGLPDWAKAVAAPPVPEGVPDVPARVLLSETRTAVQPDGTLRIRRRFVTQVLSARAGEEVGIGQFFFESTAKVTATRAWHLTPDERTKRSHSAPVDFTAGDSFLTDNKVRAIPVAGVRKGSVVFFEFEATERPYFLSLRHLFYEGAPVAVARFELETPPGWSVRPAWLRRPGPDPAGAGNVRIWELRDLPAPLEEELGDSPIDRAPLLFVQLAPPGGSSTGPAVFADWAAVSRWYDELGRGREVVTPAIKTAASKSLASAGPAPLDRIDALARFVRDGVRYTAVELGIGGYQPRPAADTLANLYGDCKDKSTLFRSLLAAGGIRSYPVLVPLGIADAVPEEVPAWGFNHVIVAVQIPEGTPPGRFAPAILNAGDLGRLLIVDTTNERAAVGSIPAGLAGHRALIVAGPRGRLVTLPEGSPEANRIERRIRTQVKPDRSLSIGRESTFIGEFAAQVRQDFGASSAERRKRVEARMLRAWFDARITDYAVEPETRDGAFREIVTCECPALPDGGPTSKVPLFAGAEADVERVPLGRRKTPVVYSHPMTIRYDVTVDGLPGSAMAPEPQSLSGDGWAVSTTYSREGAVQKATWELRLSRTRFEPAAFPELRRFWAAVSSTSGWLVDLSVSGPPP